MRSVPRWAWIASAVGIAGTLAVAPALAETYTDGLSPILNTVTPGGGWTATYVAVGTNGSDANGWVGVSQGGCAGDPGSGFALAVGESNRCDEATGSVALGLLGADADSSMATVADSGDVWAYYGPAVTLTGNVEDGRVGATGTGSCNQQQGDGGLGACVSGTGSATTSKLAAVSGTGSATASRNCWTYQGVPWCAPPLAISGTGGSSSNGGVAVSGAGPANAYNGGAVAVAGGDASAYGGLVAVSATGDARGGSVLNVGGGGCGC